MSALNDIEDREMREKIENVQSIFPGASSKLCQTALLESAGSIDGACCILSPIKCDLSDKDKRDIESIERSYTISEVSNLASQELNKNTAYGLSKVSYKPLRSTHNSEATMDRIIELVLPDSTTLNDLQETAPCVFSVPSNTNFEGFDRHGAVTTLTVSNSSRHEYQGYVPTKGRQNEARHKQEKISTSKSISVGKTSYPTKISMVGSIFTGYPTIGNANRRTTRSMIQQSSLLPQQASDGFQRSHEFDKSPFYRISHTAEDSRRLAFTAAAVIRAALVIEPEQKRSRKSHELRSMPLWDARNSTFKTFHKSRGLFEKWQGAIPINDGSYIGTNRSRYMPSPWVSAADSNRRGFIHVISAQGQYKNCSFEELRLGDYVRNRVKAPHRFSQFRKLPAELRLMVWSFAVIPRIVELRFNTTLTSCWTPCAIPTIFHVCRESRAEAMKPYKLAFGLPDSPPNIYFAMSLDTLFLTFEHKWEDENYESIFSVVNIIDQLEAYNANDLQSIKNIAIDDDLWELWNEMLADRMSDFMESVDDSDDDNDDYCPTLDCLPTFTGLKKLQIVRNKVEGYWKQRSRLQNGLEEDQYVTENVEFRHLSLQAFRDGGHRFCECPLRDIEAQYPDWSMPALGFLEKLERGLG